MRKLFDSGYNCEHLRFSTCTLNSERQGYICNLTRGKCVGHVTLPLPYLDVGANGDPLASGLYAVLRKEIVARCPSREVNSGEKIK